MTKRLALTAAIGVVTTVAVVAALAATGQLGGDPELPGAISQVASAVTTPPPPPAPSTRPVTVASAPPATTAPATTITTLPAGSTGLFEQIRGAIVFAADAGGGESLTDPLRHHDAEINPQPMDIYAVRPGEPTRRLIASDAIERCPAVSPDGDHLAYLEVTTRNVPSIVVLSGDPAEQESRVPLHVRDWSGQLRYGDACPRWSPDSTRLAYLFSTDEVRVWTLAGEEHPVLVTPTHVIEDEVSFVWIEDSFAWSPEGDALAVSAVDGVWRVAIDGDGNAGTPELVWHPAEGGPTSVEWSSRGELAVTVVTNIPVGSAGSREEFTVYVVDAEAGHAESLAAVRYLGGASARWSPDGSRLAFIQTDGHIAVNDRSTGVTTALSATASDVAWSADGRHLLVLGDHAVSGPDLGLLLQDGTGREQLTPYTWAFEWVTLDNVSWAPS